MENGWIKLHRKALDNPIWRKSNYVAVWLYILIHANHEAKSFIWNNKKVVVERGAFIGSIKKIADFFFMSTGTVSYILEYLISEKMIEKTSNKKFTYFRVLNWEKYQTIEKKFENKLKTNEKQVETNKNDNNVKNEKNSAETSSAEIPLLIKAFEGINPASKKFYGNTTQRSACEFLINTYGLDRVLKVVEKTLIKTNTIPFFPTITTPLQLQDKWATLESKIRQYQSEKLLSKEKYKVI